MSTDMTTPGNEDIRRIAEKRCRRHEVAGTRPCDACLLTIKSVLVDLETLGWYVRRQPEVTPVGPGEW